MTSQGLRGIKPMFNGTTIHRQDDGCAYRQAQLPVAVDVDSRCESGFHGAREELHEPRQHEAARRVPLRARRTARERPDRRAGRRGHGPPGVHQAGNGAGPLGRCHRLGARRLRHAARVRRSDGREGGRPAPRRHHPAPGGQPRSPHLPRSGWSDDRRHRGRVPDPGDADPDPRPGAGAQLEAERKCLRVDVQAAPERQVPERAERSSADDVVATYDRLCRPRVGSKALSALKGVLSPGGDQEDRQPHDRVPSRRPDADFPYLTSSTTYQAIFLPANYKLGTFEKTPQTTGAFRLTSYTPGRRRKVRPQSGLVGWQGAARRRRRHVLLRRLGCRSRPCSAARSTSSTRSSSRPAGRCSTTRTPRSSPPAGQRTGRCRCGSTRRTRSRTTRAPGDRAHARSAGDRQDPVQQPRRRGQRLTVRPRLSVNGQERAAAEEEPPARQAADGQGGLPQGLQDHAHDGEGGRDPGSWPRSSSAP